MACNYVERNVISYCKFGSCCAVVQNIHMIVCLLCSRLVAAQFSCESLRCLAFSRGGGGDGRTDGRTTTTKSEEEEFAIAIAVSGPPPAPLPPPRRIYTAANERDGRIVPEIVHAHTPQTRCIFAIGQSDRFSKLIGPTSRVRRTDRSFNYILFWFRVPVHPDTYNFFAVLLAIRNMQGMSS